MTRRGRFDRGTHVCCTHARTNQGTNARTPVIHNTRVESKLESRPRIKAYRIADFSSLPRRTSLPPKHSCIQRRRRGEFIARPRFLCRDPSRIEVRSYTIETNGWHARKTEWGRVFVGRNESALAASFNPILISKWA